MTAADLRHRTSIGRSYLESLTRGAPRAFPSPCLGEGPFRTALCSGASPSQGEAARTAVPAPSEAEGKRG
jgi:hypothetical protein